MKRLSIVSLLIIVLTLALTIPVAADTSTPPDRGQPSGNPMQKQIDNLVSSGVITAAQEEAIIAALKPSEGEAPTKGQDMSTLAKTKLDSLVSAGTITQTQEEAVLTASQPPSGSSSSPTGNRMQSQIDNLVSSGVITAAQEEAIIAALKPSEGEAPTKGQDMSTLAKTKLDSLVSAGTITQAQEEAVLTAIQPSSAGGDKGMAGSSSSTTSSANGIVLKIGSSKIMIKGTEKDIDPGYQTAPIIENSRTFIPIRTVIENLGGTVQWLDADQSVTITLNGSTVVLKIGQKTATVNGTTKEIDDVPFISDSGRTMLPIRFIAENLGLTVNWDESTQTITIS